MAAFRSSAPVMAISPKPCVAPRAPPNTAVPVPKLNVNARAVLLALFTASLKVTLLLVVVKVASAPKVTAPE